MLFYFACEAAGASSTRHSLRPLNFRCASYIQSSRASRGEIAEVWVFRQGKWMRTCCEYPCHHGAKHNRIGGLYPSHVWGRDERSSLLGRAHRERSERCDGWGLLRWVRRQPHPALRATPERASL